MAGFFNPTQSFEQQQGPRDYATEMEAMKRRQSMIQAMAVQGQAQPINGADSGDRWIQGLSKIANAYMGAKMDAGNTKELAALGAERQASLKGELTGLLASQGSEKLSDNAAGALMNQDQNPDWQQVQKGNERSAMVSALASQHPEMRALGVQQLATQAKEKPYVDHVVGDTLYRTAPDGTTKALAQNKKDTDQWEATTAKDAEGRDVPAQRNVKTGKIEILDKNPKITTNVNTGAKYEGELSKENAKATVDVMKSTREDQATATQLVQEGTNLYKLSQSPDLISGFGADKVTWLARLAEKMGATGPNAVATTQAMMTAGAARTLELGQKLKGSFSDKDLAFLKAVAGGSIELSPQVLQHLAGLSIQVGHNAVMDSEAQRFSALEAYPEAKSTAALYPTKKFTYSLPESGFEEVNGRVKFAGALPGAAASAAGLGGVANVPLGAPISAGQTTRMPDGRAFRFMGKPGQEGDKSLWEAVR